MNNHKIFQSEINFENKLSFLFESQQDHKHQTKG
jgi:hypothetical protein